MSFKSVACQERVVELFQNAIRNNHLAHAYIFAGQEGVGKTSFSRELAKAIFVNIPVWMRVTPAIIVKESTVIISQIYFLYCLKKTAG